MFSRYLSNNRDGLKKLVKELRKHFAYVSVLGTDIKGMGYRVERDTSAISETDDTERGFVVKMSNGQAFFEYSFDNLPSDIASFANEIVSKVKLPKLNEGEVATIAVDDEPLVKDFIRENDIDQFSNEEIMKQLTIIKDQFFAKDPHFVSCFCGLSTLTVSKIFISENRELTQNYGWVNGYIVGFYSDERMISVREGHDSNYVKEVLEVLPTRLDALLNKAQHLVKAKPVTPGVYDIITAPSITGLIAHEAFGHGVEMDQFVKDRAIGQQYIGKYVASPLVNMHDGASATSAIASYFFDDDGVLAHDTLVIKNGILQTGICDLVSSRELKTNPTGNGRRESFRNKAYTRMTNTFFEKGKDKLEDMIKSVKHGYMLFETNNGMEDPKNWAIQCVAEYGIEIIDGKLTDNYVSPVVMSGYVPDLLKSISMISDDFKIDSGGFCGKGYKEWVRVSDGGPALKARVKLS